MSISTFFTDAAQGGSTKDLEALEQWGAHFLRLHQPGQPGADLTARSFRRLASAVTPELTLLETWQIEAKAPEQPTGLIDQAIEQSSQAHLSALRDAGLPISALALLQSWMELNVGAMALQQRIADLRAHRQVLSALSSVSPQLVAKDPAEPLSAVELGQALGCSDETVRNHERDGKLFSILRPGRQRGREYPAFQAWPWIAGEPLAIVLTTLGGSQRVDAADAYGFFTSKDELLASLTPVEALIGSVTTTKAISDAARDLLASPADERLRAVLEAAKAYSAQVRQ